MKTLLIEVVLQKAIWLAFIALAVHVKAITWQVTLLFVTIDIVVSFLTAIILAFSKKEG